MERYVALLRGVNVGGKNKIAMKSLAGLFEDAKCHNVATYIQSGNVVFSATAKAAEKAGASICAAIQEQFGFETHVILRSRHEIEQIAQANPYVKPDIPLGMLHVSFLANTPAPELIKLLDINRSLPDQFTVNGSEIYLYLPNGGGNTKLTNTYFDSKLKTVTTVRNWRTLQQILDMMQRA